VGLKHTGTNFFKESSIGFQNFAHIASTTNGILK